MLGGETIEHVVKDAVEFQVLRNNDLERLLRFARTTEGREHIHHVHDRDDCGEQNRQAEKAHARSKAHRHRQKHAADVLRAAGNGAETHQVEHAHNGDTRAKIAVDQGNHHLHDERQERQRNHEVLRVPMAKHVDPGNHEAEDDRHDGTQKKARRRNRRDERVGGSEHRREHKI